MPDNVKGAERFYHPPGEEAPQKRHPTLFQRIAIAFFLAATLLGLRGDHPRPAHTNTDIPGGQVGTGPSSGGGQGGSSGTNQPGGELSK